jgi:dethiobiotin synthetase
MACHEENVDTLRQLLPAPLLGELPHLKPFDPKKAAQNLDIKTLF